IINALVDEGTWFNGKSGRSLKARAHWLAYRAKSRGQIIVDEGCKKALLERHTSLLPKGIIDVEGRFQLGQVVDLVDQQGTILGRGIVNYGSEEIKLIKGLNTSEIINVLHYKDYDEVVHANNIIINDEIREAYLQEKQKSHS
ncbi:MAG: PUA domain-containing protein, partial [bacterium]